MQNTRKWGVALSVAAIAVASAGTVMGLSGPAGATVATGQVTAAGSTAPGGTWGPAQPVPGLAALAPHGSTVISADINAISCATPGNCAAVGSYVVDTSGHNARVPLVVTETNGTWGNAQKVTGAVLSTANSPALENVSCGAPGDCTATGYSGAGPSQQAFFVTEALGAWGTASPIDASALGTGVASKFIAVSCSAAGECAAVGYYVPANSFVEQAFVMDEDSGSWGAAEPVPGLDTLQPTADSAYLTSVSCAGPGDCTAAGFYSYGSGDYAPLLVTEVTHKWGDAGPVPAFSALASPGGQVNGELDSISCPEAAACTAVGTDLPPADEEGARAFTVDESSAGWGNARQLSAPGPFDLTPGSSEVSCSSAGNCATMGVAGGKAFAATESGDGNWSAGQFISGIPAGDASVPTAVSCAPGGDCTVAGYYYEPVLDGGHSPQVNQVFVAAGSPGGSLGAARPLLSPDSGATGPDCPQTGYCVLAASSPGLSLPELVTEETAAAVTLKASRSSVTFGAEQAETLTATVASPAGGTPAGTVTITRGTSPVCTIKLARGTGKCTLTPEKLPGGHDKLTAAYSGDATYVPATSTTNLTVYGARSATRLTLAKTTITYGHENTEKLTISVSQTGNVGPTGKVTITAGRTTICTITLSKDAGNCTLTAKRLSPGTYRITASYPGNGNYDRSTSPAKTLKVTR